MMVTGTRLASGAVLSNTTFFIIEPDKTTTVDLVMRESKDQVQVIGNFNSEATYRPVGGTDLQSILQTCGAELVVYAICALQYAPANTSPIVAAGGLLAIIAQIFQWIGLVQLCLSRRKVKDRDCHEIWAKLRGSSCLCAALLAVAACGCLLRQGWLLAAGYAMDALLAYAMYRKIKGLTFSLLPGDGSTFTED